MVFAVVVRELLMRRLGPGTEGDGVEGDVASAAITACLRFIPAVSAVAGGVMGGKGSSVGGEMIATEGAPVLGSRAAE